MLRDGESSIDFVLCYQVHDLSTGMTVMTQQQQQKQLQKQELYDMHNKRRKVFQSNLLQEGLVLEEDFVPEVPLRWGAS